MRYGVHKIVPVNLFLMYGRTVCINKSLPATPGDKKKTHKRTLPHFPAQTNNQRTTSVMSADETLRDKIIIKA